MEKRYDVAALGELLIDFTRSGVSPQGNPLWEANPGGGNHHHPPRCAPRDAQSTGNQGPAGTDETLMIRSLKRNN